jgi:UDP-2,3-diacylglucosamine hydrolase
MSTAIPHLGIIAGNRSLPIVLAQQARQAGIQRLTAVAFEGETEPELAQWVDEIVWIKVGQLSRLISALVSRGITRCVMVGQIAPPNLFRLRPDLRALSLLLRLKEKNAHTIFGAIADELKKEGVELMAPVPWLKPVMPGPGFHLGPPLSPEQRVEVDFGFRLAKEIARLDIGQIVVVRHGTVLAVEGFEGTDACLRRGGELAGKQGGAIAIKVAKDNHDLRFDIPCIGPKTLETCAAVHIAALAFEAEKTLVLEQSQLATLTHKHRIALVATG